MAIEYRRYVHAFKQGELEELVKEVGGDEVLVDDGFMENGNWCVQFTKLQ